VNPKRPPRLGSWLLRRLIDRDVSEWVVPEIEHRYGRLRNHRGLLYAQRWFWKQVIYGAAGVPAPAALLRPKRNSRMSISDAFGSLARDVRFSFRELLVKHPAPTAVAVLTLALGIGANTAIFSVLHAVLLRPLPFADAGELAMIWRDTARGETTWISAAEFFDYRDELADTMEVAVFGDQDVNLTGDGEPLRVLAAAVSANYFDVLGVTTQIGRTFSTNEEGPGAAPLALLGDGLWRRRYGADPGIVGRDILVNGTPRTVIGVLPAGLRLPIDYREETLTELYVPLPLDRSNAPQRGNRGWHAVARLAPGTDLAEARQVLDAVHQRWIAEGLFGTGDFTPPGLVGIEHFLFGEVRPMLLILAGAAGFVLAIACANVASLMLARGESRRREIGVRVALGAGRLRVARQVLTEAMVLALLGGALAMSITVAIIGFVRRWAPAHVPRLEDLGVDGALAGIALGMTLLTGLLFGLLPAAHAAGAQPKDLLAEGAQGVGRQREGLRRALLVGELALAVMLAVAALLMVRSFAHVRAVELGFDPARVLTLRLELPDTGYAESATRTAFWTELIERIETLPGVQVAGAARRLPLASNMGNWSITIEGREPVEGENPNGDFQVVVPGYFEAMGMELVRGRLLAHSDRASALPVVVVSEAMAATYWPEEDAIGKRFRIGDEATPWYEIVGIVRGMKHNTVLEGPRTEMYHAVPQWGLAASVPRGMSVVVRTGGDPLGLAEPVRRQIAELDPSLPVADLRTMEEVVGSASADTRFATGMLAAFGTVAMLLAATGIYGVVSYSVRRRTREIGIRMAIGADRAHVLTGVLRECALTLAFGLLLGLAGALALGGLLAGLLVGVGPLNLPTYAIVVATAAAVALLSALVPARRAATIDPLEALRNT